MVWGRARGARVVRWMALVGMGLALGACGDDDGGGADAGEDAGPVDAWVPGDAGETVRWSVTVRDLVSGDPVQLAEVCVFGFPQLPCGTTDRMGETALDVPVNLELQLRTTALRYFPTLTTYVADDAPRDVDIDLGKTSNITPLIASVGVTLDDTKGQLAFLAQSGPGDGLEGVAASLDPASGEGPFYTNGSIPDETLEATSDDGLGVFGNVDPGAVDVVYANPNGGCAPSEGWPSPTADALSTHIEPGHLTIVIARCDPPPVDAGIDAGPADAGVEDAGAMDAGAMDAGPADAGM
ncbi:MAG TPA: hypothetical protein RMH85_32420 [Polyangiaceae bacterium LLY-WYZ-15_(1-7)]|nr:hypothetical protein [Polyangiaceae bacterium LLY-WYZ-15_(1-7)]HJL13234.1 hypothetical protein [Polyangiaceae bacterium LLY-WYZ-15_(1-7)]HJL31997.1 hypothetical protein [Polyangiaceae bacterium LLY-WYZ-15_(1-7)]